MKIIKYIFFVLLIVFVSSLSFAQDDVYYSPNNKQKKEKEEKDFNPKKRKINSGYVFIDGKYVEPPYRFKVKGNSLYINKQKACTQPTYSWAIELKKKDIYRAGYPPCVSKDSDWDERKNCKIDGLDVSYDYMMKKYYLKKYKVDVAYDSIVNYYRNYPNVKSFEEFVDLGSGYYEIICYNGYETLYQFDKDIFIKKHSEKKSQKTNDVLEMYSEVFKSSINDGNVLFFNSDLSVKGVNLTSEEDIFAICSYNSSDSLPVENVITSSFTINKKMVIKQVLEEYKNNDNLKNRIQNSKKTSNEKSESNTMKNVSKTFDLNNYSPGKNKFVAFFPVDYEINVSNMIYEIESVESNIEDQGYFFSNENYLYDQTANDDDFANMPYSQLTELSSGAGFLYVGTHGNINTLLIARGMNPNLLGYWCNYDEDVYIVPVDEDNYPSEWEINNPLFAAVVNSDWINKYWKNDLENNNTITILSACKAISGIGDACAGGICFGYDDDTYYYSCIENNRNLLKRMNGKKRGAQYRNAIDAYDHMLLLNGFNYVANANITLCPATKTCYPANNASVIAGTNSGYFEIDTWCDASIPASSALSLEFSNGNLSFNPATDVIEWEDPGDDEKSNKIIYNWSGTHGTVKVNINTNNIIAYGGGGQKLDFDRKAPNGEANAYYVFNVGYSNVNTVDFVASQYEVLENTEIQFTNQSTVIDATSYYWDFGDGTNSTQENPAHTYTQEGIFDVTLRVSTSQSEYYETKNGLITVKTECSGNLYASYDILFNKTVDFNATYTGAYEPLVDEYRFTIYYGDGTHQSIQDISNMVNFQNEYTEFGDYYPVIVVESIDQFGETLCIKEYELGLLQLNNPDPCNGFEVDFYITPEVGYLTAGNSPKTMSFINTTTGGTNCTWHWFFDADIDNGYVPVGGIDVDVFYESNNHSGTTSKNYEYPGIYPVTFTVFDENGCNGNTTKNVYIANPLECVSNLKISCPGSNPEDGSDQLDYSNRLLVQWKDQPDECVISLYSNFIRDDGYAGTCNGTCFDDWNFISYNWFINGTQQFANDITMQNYPLYYVPNNPNTPYNNINISTYLLNPYVNTVGSYMGGHTYNEMADDPISCYDETEIQVIAINCDGFMDSGALNYAYLSLIHPMFFPDYTANGFVLERDTVLEFFSGNMSLDEDANYIVNGNNVVLYACNEVELTDGFTTGTSSFETRVGDNYILQCTPSTATRFINNNNQFAEQCLENSIPSLSINPNPVSDAFQIDLVHTTDGFVLLEIFDSQGKLLKSIKSLDIEPSEYSFQVNNFNVPPGMYLCRYSNRLSSETIKFIKK